MKKTSFDPTNIDPFDQFRWRVFCCNFSSREEDEAQVWTEGIAREWADELNDSDQDIYTLADGEPVRQEIHR